MDRQDPASPAGDEPAAPPAASPVSPVPSAGEPVPAQASPADGTTAGLAPEPTKDNSDGTAEAPTSAAPDPATEVPQRWSGSAAVPAATPKKSRWSRRRVPADLQQPPAQPPAPADPWAGTEDWSHTPPVDPWADHDTPLDVFEPFPEALPPTRIDAPPTPAAPAATPAPLPPTRVDPPAGPPPLPPTRIDPPAAPPPTRVDPPATRVDPPAAPQPAAPQPAAPPAPSGPKSPPPAPPRKRGLFRRSEKNPQPAANRVPVQPRTAPPAPARPLPPGYAQRAQPKSRPLPPPRPRRKRRWGRRLLAFTLLSALCCCGVPAYFAYPAAQQYPVTAALPQTIADLDLRDTDTTRQALDRLTGQLSGTALVTSGDPFAGVYADGNGKRVTVFGSTGFRLTPESDVEDQLARLTDEFSLTTITAYDLGVTGAHERCGVGRSGDSGVVVCAWADHGSLAAAIFTRRAEDESADLTAVLREQILTPRWGGEISSIL